MPLSRMEVSENKYVTVIRKKNCGTTDIPEDRWNTLRQIVP